MLELETRQLQTEADYREKIAKITASNAKPKDQLEPLTAQVLKFFFQQSRTVTGAQIAQYFRLMHGVADHHIDILLANRFITPTPGGTTSASCGFEIEPAGRSYIVRNGLAT